MNPALFLFLSFFKSSPQDVHWSERERERERERDQSVASHMCPDGESNPQPFVVWDSAPTNWATWSGLQHFSLRKYTLLWGWSPKLICSQKQDSQKLGKKEKKQSSQHNEKKKNYEKV